MTTDEYEPDLDRDEFGAELADNEDEFDTPEEDEAEDEPQMECYYADPQHCRGELWECQTCGEEFCDGHWHETDLGVKVECVSCERTRKEKEKE